MEKDYESWLHQRQREDQFPNANSLKLKLPFDEPGMRTPRTIPSVPLKETHGWFYCLPRSRKCLVPDKATHDKFVPEMDIATMGRGVGDPGFDPGFKQFLVFDQTGDKMTMMFTSGIGGTSIPQPNVWARQPSCEDGVGIKSDGLCSPGPNLTDGLKNEEESDMHENSEEINALLYSEENDMHENSEEINALLYSDENDDDDDTDEGECEGEEESTGNSPSTMTAFEKTKWVKGDDVDDEVSSSEIRVKRKKSFEEHEDDTESSNAVRIPVKGLSPGSKRTRIEKIRETVSVLQTILPGGTGKGPGRGQGKDVVMVLDEAIDYLKTLKFKAESLRLSGGRE